MGFDRFLPLTRATHLFIRVESSYFCLFFSIFTVHILCRHFLVCLEEWIHHEHIASTRFPSSNHCRSCFFMKIGLDNPRQPKTYTFKIPPEALFFLLAARGLQVSEHRACCSCRSTLGCGCKHVRTAILIGSKERKFTDNTTTEAV